MDMKTFDQFIDQVTNDLPELKEALGTKGHAYQTALKDKIESILPPEQKGRVVIKVASASSTLPDIQIFYLDRNGKQIDKPLIIECKLNNSQSGGITWRFDGTNWSITTGNRGRAAAVCAAEPDLCAVVTEMLKNPIVRKRIDAIQGELAAWHPTLNSKQIPFTACKEFWPTLLDKHTTLSYGGKWQVPVTNIFWKSLNTLMQNDHFLSIKGAGLFRVGGANFPSWFVPSSDYLNRIPVISSIDATPKGNLELRLKPTGMKARTAAKQARELRIHITDSNKPPKNGDWVHVEGLGSLGKKANYVHPVGLVGSDGKPVKYIANSTESGSIGQIANVRSVNNNGSVWVVDCDLVHRVGTITFETNLRILDVGAKSAIDMEKDSDAREFMSFFKD